VFTAEDHGELTGWEVQRLGRQGGSRVGLRLETVTTRAVGASTSACSLPEGTCFLSGRTTDSIRNVAVSDYR
jgi:hypothetical protein